MSGIEYVALVIGTIMIVVLIGIRNWRKKNGK
jgi:hypothetical protein